MILTAGDRGDCILIKKIIVNSVYNFLLSANHHIIANDNHVIWYQNVPLKVNFFVWRLLCNRLPTKYNLIKRAVISSFSSLRLI